MKRALSRVTAFLKPVASLYIISWAFLIGIAVGGLAFGVGGQLALIGVLKANGVL